MRIMALALFSILTACGSGQEARDVSQVHFITFGPNVSGLVSKVKQPRMRACLSGVADGQEALWTQNIQSVILKWVAPLRSLTSAALTTEVDVVTSRSACDTEIVVSSGTHSNTSIGQLPIVRMDPNGYFASYNVLLHEFGHAFALSDTYQNGQSGNCQPGQPQAVMCNTSFADLQADDASGVSAIFKRVFPQDEPPKNPPENSAVTLYLALGKEASAGRFEFYVGADGASTSDTGASAAYCLGTRDECTSTSAAWRDLADAGSRSGVPIFKLDGGFQPVDGQKLTLRYRTETSVSLHQVVLTSKG